MSRIQADAVALAKDTPERKLNILYANVNPAPWKFKPHRLYGWELRLLAASNALWECVRR